ncbi:MAG: CopG family transcriptional regulator [Euryarchaeota archaeon]|nr:CopG family transcriptional regulator [Euryarchaeota archaeon]MDE1837722.1 CopG family transcriptional regulator [Euryarchaeota archaeon]MDE1880952.1 CopG family transcriptional regulator [Euryarchaeota archaeon]MDE2046115.1 CopG family transcriptional regulator [Thermoplasmata archaeon]
MPEATVPVQISQELRDRVQARLKGSAFSSVDDFVSFVLARLVEGPSKSGEPLSPEDEARVKGRLRSLGYID